MYKSQDIKNFPRWNISSLDPELLSIHIRRLDSNHIGVWTSHRKTTSLKFTSVKWNWHACITTFSWGSFKVTLVHKSTRKISATNLCTMYEVLFLTAILLLNWQSMFHLKEAHHPHKETSEPAAHKSKQKNSTLQPFKDKVGKNACSLDSNNMMIDTTNVEKDKLKEVN